MWAPQDEWARDQALRRSGGHPDGPKEADTLRLKLQEAQEELDATRSSLAAAEKGASDAEKALQRLATPASALGKYSSCACILAVHD